MYVPGPRAGRPRSQVARASLSRLVAKHIVQFGAGLHFCNDGALRTFLADRGVDFERSGGGGSGRAQRIECHRDARGAKLVEGEVRRLAKLREVGEDGNSHSGGERFVVFERAERFSEDHVRARGDVGLGAFDRRGKANNGRGVGARHDDEVRIGFTGDGGADPRNHIGDGNELFTGKVTAKFGRDLILDVYGRDTDVPHLAYGGGGIIPTRIDVDEERKINTTRNPSRVDEHVRELGEADIGLAVGVIGNAGAGKVDRLKPGALGEQRRVCVDRAYDLERPFGGDCSTKTCARS